MPARKVGRRAIKNVTLCETLNWIAFDNIAGPGLHPEEMTEQIFGQIDIANVETLEIELYKRVQNLGSAEDDLYAALRDGDIGARGHFSKTNKRSSSPVDWMNQEYVSHADTRTAIPANFWRREGIDWESSKVKSPNSEYADIVLSWDDVFTFWPLEDSNGDILSQDQIPSKKGGKGGRPEKYDWNGFWIEVVRIANMPDGLPERQGELVRRMLDWCGRTWEEIPGETTVKDRIRRLYQAIPKRTET